MPDINATLNTNFAKLGFYSDQQSLRYATVSREMIDRLAADGYGGVLFEITVGISTDGTLQNKLTYNELYSLMDYADMKGLKTGILPNWNFNGGNADYIGQTSLGQTRPPEFNMNNMLNSMKTFINGFLPKLQDHGLDIFYLSQHNPDFFTSEYRSFWVDAINGFRAIYSGALSNQVWSISKNVSQSMIEKSSIWDQLDAIGVWAKPYISNDPVYNIDDIISGYFGSKINGKSFINEIINASNLYKKPILVTSTAMSLPNALDGGWDPTSDQALQSPLPLNPELQKLVFTSLFQVISNNLKGIVTSVSIGNYEPWTYGDFSSQKPSSTVTLGDIALWSTFKFFDMSLFPSQSESVIQRYLQDPYNFKVSNNTFGSAGNDLIYTSLGNNNIYLNGGFDAVTSSLGNDSYYVSAVYKKNIKFDFGNWITKPSDALRTIKVDLGNEKIYSFKFVPTKTPFTSNGYWDSNSIELSLPSDTKLESVKFSLETNGFAQISNLLINNISVDGVTGTHTKVESWSAPNWLVAGDEYTFDLRSFIKNNYQGKTSVIDGGAGVDKIYFENATAISDFKLTVLPNKINFYDIAGKYPPVEATNVERLIFSDKSIAIDINGNAGSTAKLLGAVFGKDSLTNKQYVGIGLSLLDAGMSTTTLASLAVDAANLKTNDQIVSTLWKNVFGTTATSSDKAPYVKLLDDGMSPGTLAWLAADTTFNKVNINLVGLAQTGLEYIPVS